MASIAKLEPKAKVGTVHWFNECVERGKRGVFAETTEVSPGLAAEILRRNENNRHISPTKAEHYALDMAAGRWIENGETIIISDTGELNDGQHRMQAVIDANVVIPFLFVFGLSRDSRCTVDQGAARSAGDYLSMDGVHYATNASTVAKWLMAFERSEGRNIHLRSKITNAEIVARVKADPEIISAVAFAFRHYKNFKSLFSLTVMAACHYILSDIDPDDAEAFLEQVALGENIKRGDPAFAVRQAFMADKRERRDALEIIFHGWNAYREDRPLKLAKCYGAFPALV